MLNEIICGMGVLIGVSVKLLGDYNIQCALLKKLDELDEKENTKKEEPRK